MAEDSNLVIKNHSQKKEDNHFFYNYYNYLYSGSDAWSIFTLKFPAVFQSKYQQEAFFSLAQHKNLP